MSEHPGQHFLQIPGPGPVPERVLRAIAAPVIDHRRPEFGRLAREVLDGCRHVFTTSSPVIIYPSSGTGAWEAAIVSTLSPGDRVLMVETGHFSVLWREMAERWGVEVDFIPGDWRHGADPAAIEASNCLGCLIIALRIVSSLRMQATSATLGALPPARNRP